MMWREQGRRARGRRATSRRYAELFRILTRKRTDLTRLIGEQMKHRLHGDHPLAMGTRGDEGEAATRALTAEVESDAMDRRVRMVKQVDLALRCRDCQEAWEAAEGRSTSVRPLTGGSLPLEEIEIATRPRDLVEAIGEEGLD